MNGVYNKAMKVNQHSGKAYGYRKAPKQVYTCCICGKKIGKAGRYDASPLFDGETCCHDCFDYVAAARKYLNGIRKAAIRAEHGI